MIRGMLLAAAMIAAVPIDAQTLAVVHAEAWTMADGANEPIADATILIDGDKIVSVVPHGTVPPGVESIDATGKVVTPGLFNAATQLGLVEISTATDANDTASRDARSAQFDVSRALNGNSALVELARADGLTTALAIPSPSQQPPFSGMPSLIRLRAGSGILERANAAVYAVIGGGAWDKVGSRAAQWDLLRQAVADAGKTRPPGASRSSAIEDVAAGRVPLFIQTHRQSDIEQAMALARDFRIRVVIVGGTEAWRVAGKLAAAKIPVVVDPLANLPLTFDQLGVREDNAALLAKAGVRVAFGLVGWRIHHSLNAGLKLREGASFAISNGLPYAEALRAVTSSPFRILGEEAGGMLTPDAPADLVVWDGDPLEPSSLAISVIVEGRRVDTVTRQDLLGSRYLKGRR